MKSEFFRQIGESSLLALPVFSLLLFAAIFTVVVLRTFRRRADAYEQEAALVFTKEERK